MSFANSNMLGNEIHRSQSNIATQRSHVPLPWHENRALNQPILQTAVYQHNANQEAMPYKQVETYGAPLASQSEYQPMSMIVKVNSTAAKEEPCMSLTQISEMIASQNSTSHTSKRMQMQSTRGRPESYLASHVHSDESDHSDSDDDEIQKVHPDGNSCEWHRPKGLEDSIEELQSKVRANSKILESHSVALQNHRNKIEQIGSNEKDVRVILQNHNKHITNNKTVIASHGDALRDCHGVLKKMKNDLIDVRHKSDLDRDGRRISSMNEKIKQHEDSLEDCKHAMNRMSRDLKSSIEGISEIKSKFKSRTSLDVPSGTPSRYVEMQILEQEIAKRRQSSKVK